MREPLNQSLDAGQPASGGDTIIDAAAPSIQGAAAAAQHSTPGRAPGMRRRMSSSSLADDAADAVDAADGKPAGPEFDEMMVANKQGLGALTGVFVPCMLSIIGVVLFMRLGWAAAEGAQGAGGGAGAPEEAALVYGAEVKLRHVATGRRLH